MELQEISDLRELELLEPEWTELWQNEPNATLFQSPSWLLPWWRHFGEGRLWVIALRVSARLCGLAPFFIRQQDDGPGELFLLGTGNSDYLDVLLEPGLRAKGAEQILALLNAQLSKWNACRFDQLRPGSALLHAPVPEGWNARTVVHDLCPILSLPATIKELGTVIPRSRLSRLAYCRRRLQKLPRVCFEVAREETLPELIESLIELHRARWADRGQRGVLDEPQVVDFHREAAPRLLASGVLRLYALRLGHRVIACWYGFSFRRHTQFYLGGFDPEFAAFDPGTLLIGHAIEEAIREGCDEFDFLRGDEPYKYSWGAKARFSYYRELVHDPVSGVAGRSLPALSKIKSA